MKSAAFVPDIEMPLIPRGAVPELVTVMGDGVVDTPTPWLPNARLATLKAILGAAPKTPVPLSVATGEGVERFSEFVVIPRLPVNENVVVGTKAMPILQLEPAKTLEETEQSTYPVDCWRKFPVTEIALKLKALFPMFSTVSSWDGLARPIVVDPKANARVWDATLRRTLFPVSLK